MLQNAQNGEHAADEDALSPAVTVSIVDDAFDPAQYTVTVGTEVVWTNSGAEAHTVTSEGFWDSGTLNPGESFRLVLDSLGTYAFACAIHPEMTGAITVEQPETAGMSRPAVRAAGASLAKRR